VSGRADFGSEMNRRHFDSGGGYSAQVIVLQLLTAIPE
jgi:hypothetical protein